VWVGLLLGFWALYAGLGFLLAETPVFEKYDRLFEIDTPRSVEDFAVFRGDHDRTSVHPIFVLLVNPVGSVLAWITGSPEVAAIVLNSMFGGLSVALAFLLLRRFTGDTFGALLSALLLGFSSSNLVCGSVPGSTALAACTLVCAHLLFLETLERERTPPLRWIAAGILCMGITTTNVVQPVISRGLVALKTAGSRPKLSVLRDLLVFLAPVGLITAALAVVQKLVYPSSRLFFTAGAVSNELPFASMRVLEAPLEVIGQVLKQLLLVNVVAPLPDLYSIGPKLIPAVTLATSWDYPGVGVAGAMLWVAWLVYAAIRMRGLGSMRATFLFGIAVCLVFNIVLHSVYGVGEKGNIELLLYSGHFTFLSVVLGSVTLLGRGWLPRLWLATLVVLAGANNLLMMTTIYGVYVGAGS